LRTASRRSPVILFRVKLTTAYQPFWPALIRNTSRSPRTVACTFPIRQIIGSVGLGWTDHYYGRRHWPKRCASRTGDGGPATQAGLGSPKGIAFGPDGSLYIAEWGEATIREYLLLELSPQSPGMQSRSATSSNSPRDNGDGGPATYASFLPTMLQLVQTAAFILRMRYIREFVVYFQTGSSPLSLEADNISPLQTLETAARRLSPHFLTPLVSHSGQTGVFTYRLVVRVCDGYPLAESSLQWQGMGKQGTPGTVPCYPGRIVRADGCRHWA